MTHPRPQRASTTQVLTHPRPPWHCLLFFLCVRSVPTRSRVAQTFREGTCAFPCLSLRKLTSFPHDRPVEANMDNKDDYYQILGLQVHKPP